MTENEATEIIKQVPLFRYECELEKGRQSDLFKALYVAIQALEEIQQYRAIGLTPELIEAMQGHNIALINDLGEYQQIGTIDEFKALKEKNEPKKIEKRGYVFVCPICKKWLQSQQENCHGCGQKLAWSE